MRIVELIRLVRVNTLQNKGRVLLTSLGIIVGTATIVLVTAIRPGRKGRSGGPVFRHVGRYHLCKPGLPADAGWV